MDFLTCTLIFVHFSLYIFSYAILEYVILYVHFGTFFDTYVHLYKYLFFELLGFIIRIRSFLKKIKLFQLFRCYNELFLDQLKNYSEIFHFELCQHRRFSLDVLNDRELTIAGKIVINESR